MLRFLLLGDDTSCPPTLDELPELCDRLLLDLARIEKRGEGCLLNDFLRELREMLVPRLVPGVARHT